MNKLALTFIAAAFAASAGAQVPGSAVPPATPGPAAGAAAKPKTPLSPTDKKWIKDVSEAILTEQKFVELVANNKTATFSEETKRTTGTMSGDLKRVWTALATLAQGKGAEVAQEIPKMEESKVQRVSKEKPDKFEKEFFKDLGKESKQAMKLFEASKTLQDADIKKFADDWAVTIKGHDVSVEAAEKHLTGGKK
ncbi:MAG TPA: DUF4142 domain-containing protein [Chthoniobacteraceae bacterium]|nr:DUF4142 domain-containing protein [Chthoniobacteraceae bacterium]